LTPDERDFARKLVRCKMRPGCYDKRFARDMAGYAEQQPDRELTAGQRDFLLKLVVRFRKQIDEDTVAQALLQIGEAKRGACMTNAEHSTPMRWRRERPARFASAGTRVRAG